MLDLVQMGSFIVNEVFDLCPKFPAYTPIRIVQLLSLNIKIHLSMKIADSFMMA